MNKREILFRGKRVDTGEWIEGYYFRQYGSNEIVTADDEQYHIFPNTVGQYTGLTDKNGTRIFEGDIISAYFGDISPESETRFSFVGMTMGGTEKRNTAMRHWRVIG